MSIDPTTVAILARGLSDEDQPARSAARDGLFRLLQSDPSIGLTLRDVFADGEVTEGIEETFGLIGAASRDIPELQAWILEKCRDPDPLIAVSAIRALSWQADSAQTWRLVAELLEGEATHPAVIRAALFAATRAPSDERIDRAARPHFITDDSQARSAVYQVLSRERLPTASEAEESNAPLIEDEVARLEAVERVAELRRALENLNEAELALEQSVVLNTQLLPLTVELEQLLIETDIPSAARAGRLRRAAIICSTVLVGAAALVSGIADSPAAAQVVTELVRGLDPLSRRLSR